MAIYNYQKLQMIRAKAAASSSKVRGRLGFAMDDVLPAAAPDMDSCVPRVATRCLLAKTCFLPHQLLTDAILQAGRALPTMSSVRKCLVGTEGIWQHP